LELLYPDNSTAVRMAQAINEYLKEERAAALDPRTVAVQVPEEFRDNEMELLAAIEKLKVEVEVKAKVVLNERTGTVIVGPGVRLLPVVISHGALKVEVTRIPVISQPMPFSEGQTVVESVTDVRAEEEETQIMELDGKDTIQDLVQALRALKVSSRDLIAIFQALKDAGALLAELEIR
jgi:flagellar P-ring protein precursor FlgI